MANLNFTGWTSRSTSPTLASRVITPRTAVNTESSVGAVNAAAQTLVTADKLVTPALADATLGSRAVAERTPKDVAITASVYQQPDMPAFLQESIDSLNANQSMKRAVQAEWVDKLFKQATGGDWQAWEALRAASVQPGANVAFNNSVQNPAIGQGYFTAANAYAGAQDAYTRQLNADRALQTQLSTLQQKRTNLGANAFGLYEGSDQQKLDNQISEMKQRVKQTSSKKTEAPSGWTSALPQY